MANFKRTEKNYVALLWPTTSKIIGQRIMGFTDKYLESAASDHSFLINSTKTKAVLLGKTTDVATR